MAEEKPRLRLTPERFEQEVAEEIAKDLGKIRGKEEPAPSEKEEE
jgi:hypothetical protein